MISSIKSPDSVVILGLGAPFELPIAFLQVLVAFAEPTPVERAFQMLEVDVDADEFEQIIGDFVRRGLLTPSQPDDDGCNLQQLLNSRIFGNVSLVEQIGGWMRQGRAILVPDALPADFAEEVHRALCRSEHWVVGEGNHDFFHYRNSTINHLVSRGTALAKCNRIFRSKETRRFISGLSGQDCMGEAGVAAAWYRANEYALPHDDSYTKEPRSVAYIWYLAKEWQRDWGGTLFWCPTGQYISPRFNMLMMFNVMPSNVHFVCPVSPAATAKRLTINGFWHRSQPAAPSSRISPDIFVSPRAYGPSAPNIPEQAHIFVL